MQMLEEYSTGRVLHIQTGRIRKIKNTQKKSKPADEENSEENDGEWKEGDPEPDFGGDAPIEEDIVDDEEEEDRNEIEEHVEKSFNFISETASMVEYPVISSYCIMLRDLDILKEPTLVPFIANFFTRVVNQLKAEWIFFQVDYMNIFNEILQNSEITSNARFSALVEIIKKIVGKFFELSKTNHLLFVEALFRIPNRTMKEEILGNYEAVINMEGGNEDEKDNEHFERAEILKDSKAIWSEADDEYLIEHYPTLKNLENCFTDLAKFLKDPLKTQENVFLQRI